MGHHFYICLSLLMTLLAVNGQVPLSDFYPYGTPAGDRALAREDDASTVVPIFFAYPFFGTIYREVHISTNGLINFGSGDPGFIPQPFPLQDFRSVASYWTDSDPSRGGNVFYRESEDPVTLSRITEEIRSRFVGYSSFVSRWALIVTFDRVAPFGCVDTINAGSISDNNYKEGAVKSKDARVADQVLVCRQSCNNTVTYQTVLTSNGVQSFALFSYNQLMFTVGTYACQAHAQVGFNAGDARRFYLVPSSNTPSIAQVALTNSNVGVPGKWMFSIDGADISEGCNFRGLLEIFPRKVLYFGQDVITIGGPCFSRSTTTVTVTFGSVSVVCSINSALQAVCVAPYFSKLGYNDIFLTYNSTTYTSYIVVIDSADITVSNSDVNLIEREDINSAFTIQWDVNTAGTAGEMFLLKGFQTDYFLDESGAVLSEDVVPLNYSTIPNTGTITLRPVARSDDRTGRVIRQISLAGYRLSSYAILLVRVVGYVTNPLCTSHCNYWYRQQPSTREMRVILDQVSRRSPCPPAVTLDFPATTGDFVLDGSCNPSNPILCAVFHPGAKGCYRSTNNNGGKVSQCCYNQDARLLLGPPAGGSMDFADSSVSIWEHFKQDVLPYLTCCKCNRNDRCSMYYDKRPSVDSRFFRPPGSGGGGGDPHFTTLDGTSYTFNPIGEFTYLTTDEDTIQARITRYVDSQGVPKEACYFSAFVVQNHQFDKVQVELSATKHFNFRVNGQTLVLDFGLWRFRNIVVNYQNNASVVLSTASSLELELLISGGVLHALLSLPDTARGKVHGLIGDWDGDAANDLQLPDSTTIPVTSSTQDIHYNFGLKWSTTNITSLFYYPSGLFWSDFQDTTFTPNFNAPPPVAACNGDTQCEYDASVTGDISVGLSNVATKERMQEIKEFNSVISKYCPTSVTVTNGDVTVEEIVAGTTVRYTVRCHDGFVLHGGEQVTCVNGEYDQIGSCESSSSGSLAMLSPRIYSLVLGSLAISWLFNSALMHK